MEYKLTENGNIAVNDDGHPVIINDEGNETWIDALNANKKIAELNLEARKYRKKSVERQTKLDKYNGVDPDEVIKALDTVNSLDDKMKVKLDELKSNINKTWEEKEKEWNETKLNLENNLFQATVGAKFATSEVIKQTVLPPDIAQNTFAKYFSIDGTAKDKDGNVIYSTTNPGEPASFDEAMKIILDNYPHKESILKSQIKPGSGGFNNGEQGGEPNTNSSIDNIKNGLKERGV